MRQERRMTMVDLLCFLREQLVSLREGNNQEGLRRLWDQLQFILEAAYKHQDKEVASILEEMEDSIRDSLMGVEWKSSTPSLESIRALEGKPKAE